MNDASWVGVALALISAAGGAWTLYINSRVAELKRENSACKEAAELTSAELAECRDQHATADARITAIEDRLSPPA